MKKQISKIIILMVVYCGYSINANAQSPQVVVTIKPLHALVAEIMGDTGEPLLLIDQDSAHDVRLKPSQMRALQKADMLFYIDENFESFLKRTTKSLPEKVTQIALMQQKQVTLYPYREGAIWESHNHNESDHADEHEDEHEEHDDAHDEEGDDPHIWLDIENSRVMVDVIAAQLSLRYPQHKAVYRKNAAVLSARLTALGGKLKQKMAHLPSADFIVFHDAYQYLEHYLGIKASGAITLMPNDGASPKRLREIRHVITQRNISCIFTEPYMSPRLMQSVTEGFTVRHTKLDPLGSEMPAGVGMYDSLMEGLVQSIYGCLKK